MTDAKNNSRFGLIFIERTGREKFKHITVRKYSDFNASRRARVMTNYTLYETVGMKDTVVEIMLFISRGLFFIALAAAVVGIFLLAFKFKKRAFAIVLTLTTLVGAYFGIFGTVRNNANIKKGSEREFFDTVIADDATEYKTETDLIIANVSVCKGKNNIESAIADITSSKYQYYTVDGLDCYIGAVKCGNLDYHSLSIANTGGGDVVLTDGEKAVCLSYGYKYGVADIFFPVVGKEAFHCKEIDLKTVSDIIKNRNSKNAPKVYVWY